MKVSKVIVNGRRSEIMKYIQEKSCVTVEELVAVFNVSAVTIRRDLQYWEDVGAIERNYGGACLLQEFVKNYSNYNRLRYMKAIAKRAAQFIDDNDVVFINTSMTAIMAIDYIKKKNVTIITNNAKAINYIPNPDVTIILTGGEVRYPKNSLFGTVSLKIINSINANKCIIGCSGLSKNGITTGFIKEMAVNKAMLDHTKQEKVILCDHTKIGLDYSFNYCDFNDIDYIITDIETNKETMNEINNINEKMKIVYVEPMPVRAMDS